MEPIKLRWWLARTAQFPKTKENDKRKMQKETGIELNGGNTSRWFLEKINLMLTSRGISGCFLERISSDMAVQYWIRKEGRKDALFVPQRIWLTIMPWSLLEFLECIPVWQVPQPPIGVPSGYLYWKCWTCWHRPFMIQSGMADGPVNKCPPQWAGCGLYACI